MLPYAYTRVHTVYITVHIIYARALSVYTIVHTVIL